MKTILILLIFSLTLASSALGDLSIQDIEKIDTKIKASETRMKEHINTQIESVDKRLSLVTTLIVGLIALIVLDEMEPFQKRFFAEVPEGNLFGGIVAVCVVVGIEMFFVCRVS